MDVNNLTNVYNQNPTLQGQYTLQQYLDMFGGSSTGTTTPPTTGNPTSTPIQPNQGIINQNINKFQGDNEGNINAVYRDGINYQNPGVREYGPGGMYEINPSALGMSFTTSSGKGQPQKGSPQFQGFRDVNTGKMTARTGASEMGFMTNEIAPGINRDMISAEYNKFGPMFGRSSNYGIASVPGYVSKYGKMALGPLTKIPFAGKLLESFGANFGSKDRSDRSRYSVDNAGYGSTGARDQFGTLTYEEKDGFLGIGGEKTGVNYGTRQQDILDDLSTGFFGGMFEDINNLTPQEITAMKAKNGFYFKKINHAKNIVKNKAIKKAAKERRDREIKDTQDRIDKEYKDKVAKSGVPGGNFDVSGPDTTGNARGKSNRASQERGFQMHGADGGFVPKGLSKKSYFKGGLVSLRGR